MGHLGTDKDIEKLARKARKEGWTVGLTKNNHIKWTPPEGEFIISGLTSSSRGNANLLRRLKKAGLE